MTNRMPDNGGNRVHDPLLVMARVGEDAEPVLIQVDAESVSFGLDDGRCVVFDRLELDAALGRMYERLGVGAWQPRFSEAA